LPDTITATEERLQFLLDLEAALRRAGSAKATTAVAAELLGRHLHAGRAGFGDIILDGQVVRVEEDWAGSMGSLAGEARVLDAFGPSIIALLRNGEILVVDECDRDPRVGKEHLHTWESIGTKALIVAPLIKDAQFAGILYVHSPEPRRWTPAEISLVGDVAARTWSAHAQSKAEDALRRSEAQKRAILDAALDAIITLGADGLVLEWNRAAETMFGLLPAQLPGVQFLAHLHAPSSAAGPAQNAHPLSPADLPALVGKRLHLLAVRSDGSDLPVEVTVSGIAADRGTHFTCHIRDLTEQQRSIEALRASEDRLRDITNALPIMISYLDREQRFRFVNKPYETWFGRPIDQILGHRLNELMSPEIYQVRRPYVERALAGEQVQYVVDMPRGDGVVTTEILHVPHRDKEGRVVGLYALVQDITARQQSELALTESERQFRQLAELSPAFIWSADVDGAVTYMSQRWHEFLGSEHRHPFTARDETLHPEDRPVITRAWERSQATGLPLWVQGRFRRNDGEFIWHSIRAEPTRSLDGDVTGWLGATTDIHAAVVEAQERQRDHDRLWKISQELMLVRDQAGTIISVNPSAKRLLGWQPEEMIGKSVFDFMHPDDRERTAQYVTHQAETDDVIAIQNRYRTIDGSFRVFDWRGVTDNGLVHAVGRDITAEQQAAEELRSAEEALRQAQKMEAIGQLTGGIAHDFNNMLAGIIGSLDVIQRRIAAGRYDDMERFINGAITSSRRAASLTQRLLAFGRRQALDIRPIEIGQLVLSLHDLLRRTLGEAIEINTDVPQESSWAQADAAQLESAILNLAINARDAMPVGGRLRIAVGHRTVSAKDQRLKPGDFITVEVTDTGTGMPQAVIDKAFDPFFTTKPIGQGTGLGLSMIHGFMGQIGGDVTIRSAPGQGTTVTMFLPRAWNADTNQAIAPAFPQSRLAASGTVLVVEDDAAISMLIVSLLDELGLKSVVAVDGNAGLSILKSDVRVDLLVSDVGLPGLNGRQLAEQARLVRPFLKVLFITGYAEGAALRQADLQPGMRLITKPFEMANLGNLIQDMLASDPPSLGS
jgi:PAS domain S-box-containing protein